MRGCSSGKKEAECGAVFGLDINQTRQGCDILAQTLKCKVVMPDFFEGNAWPTSKHPPQNEEDKAACVPLLLP